MPCLPLHPNPNLRPRPAKTSLSVTSTLHNRVCSVPEQSGISHNIRPNPAQNVGRSHPTWHLEAMISRAVYYKRTIFFTSRHSLVPRPTNEYSASGINGMEVVWMLHVFDGNSRDMNMHVTCSEHAYCCSCSYMHQICLLWGWFSCTWVCTVQMLHVCTCKMHVWHMVYPWDCIHGLFLLRAGYMHATMQVTCMPPRMYMNATMQVTCMHKPGAITEGNGVSKRVW